MSETETAPPLAPLSDATGDLAVRKESWRSGVHELVADAGPVARMDYSAWSGKARAETADGVWGFSRTKGWTSSRIEITEGDGGPEVGRLDKKTWTRGGSIELGGHTYALGVKGVFKSTWSWTRDGTTLVEVDLASSFGKAKGVVRVSDVGRRDPHVSLLVLLAMHVSFSDDMTTATVVAAT